MFNVQSHTAAAIDTLRKVANASDKAGANLAQAMTAAFVAALAADPTASVKAVSVMIGDKVPQSKESGNPAATRKSYCSSFFKEDANRLDVYAAIPKPEEMDPATFTEAVITYAKSINPKAWLKDKADAAKKAAKDQADAVKAAQRDLGDDEQAALDTAGDAPLNPGLDPVLAAQTDALKAIANLSQMEGIEAETALFAILDAITAAVGGTVTVTDAEPDAIAA